MREKPIRTALSWSGGKDSSLALYSLLADPAYKVEYLLTTINEEYDRVSMHGVRIDLMERQAEILGIPWIKVQLSAHANMEEYSTQMAVALKGLKARGISTIAFGDIFLEDLRSFREKQIEDIGLMAYFPIWKRDTAQLANEFVDLGFKAMIVCLNTSFLDKSFAGQILTKELIDAFPSHVDPCGENGEFHTFVFDGPIFKEAIPIRVGEKVYRTYPSLVGKEDEVGFWFTDIDQ